MDYYNNLNEEIKGYFNILCDNDYPEFINKYIQTEELKRLANVGFFCGCDYTKLYNVKYWFSRLDHSVACALMTYNITKDKTQTLAALLHDIGAPSFSHCIDYLLNDSINQESSEKNVKEVVNSSKNIMNYIKEDNIDIEFATEVSNFTIVENKKPKICVDRLEGILCTGLIWKQFWDLDIIRKVYSGVKVLLNEYNEDEIGFNSEEVAELFYEGAFKYSLAFQENEDKYIMQFISDILKNMIESKTITLDDLYVLSENDIINIIKNKEELKVLWDKFSKADKIERTDKQPVNKYYVSVDTKKRYVVPLLKQGNNVVRLNSISEKCKSLLNEYLSYSDSKYAYINEV